MRSVSLCHCTYLVILSVTIHYADVQHKNNSQRKAACKPYKTPLVRKGDIHSMRTDVLDGVLFVTSRCGILCVSLQTVTAVAAATSIAL
jgi:hypothetical protein